ncbi:hypothetical protein [Fervidibacter sp.]
MLSAECGIKHQSPTVIRRSLLAIRYSLPFRSAGTSPFRVFFHNETVCPKILAVEGERKELTRRWK